MKLNYYLTDINDNKWLILVKQQFGYLVTDQHNERGIGTNMVKKIEKYMMCESTNQYKYVECEYGT